MFKILGWDIGAANIKAAILAYEKGIEVRSDVASQPYEIWREKKRLPEVLESVLGKVCPDGSPQAMALTMTAELSDIFASKREGVLYVLESVETAFPGSSAFALSNSGEFVHSRDARFRPQDFAATNWLASARWLAPNYPDCLIVDVGSTTTDIIPILDGQVAASGRTDTARLISGELVFTGVLRTNVAAIVQSVPLDGKFCPVASEYFVNSGDIHLILGNLK
jgi:probable H4MPT-linked C1 transfer pathway protein